MYRYHSNCVPERAQGSAGQRIVKACSSIERNAEDAWSYFVSGNCVRKIEPCAVGENPARNKGSSYADINRARRKREREQEMKENRERLAQSEKREGRVLRRRKRGRILVGAAAVLIAVVVMGSVHYRQAGETNSGRFWIWEDRGDGGVNIAGQDVDLLLLVNKDHALPDDYLPRLHWLENKSCAVAEEMYPALKKMLTDGSEEGLQFVVASGYRDSEYQKKLLDEDITASMESEGLTWQQAYDKETRETMPPGYSEHESGLAADIVSLNYQMLDAQQEDTPECQWLQENCSKYGFILRYPRGKEDITKVDYEPWHFRYVGVEAAQEIMSRGITLEEYLGEA